MLSTDGFADATELDCAECQLLLLSSVDDRIGLLYWLLSGNSKLLADSMILCVSGPEIMLLLADDDSS